MSDKRIEELMAAQEVVEEAYAHYDKADQLEIMSQQEKKKTRRRMIIGIIAWLIGMMLIPDTVYLLKLMMETAYVGVLVAMICYIRNHSKTNDLLAQMNEERQIGDQTINSNVEKLTLLQQKYWYPRTIGYILEVLETGRAADLNQALNMCDEQIHKWNLEEANEAMYEEMKRQSEHLAGIESNTAIDAAANILRFVSK